MVHALGLCPARLVGAFGQRGNGNVALPSKRGRVVRIGAGVIKAVVTSKNSGSAVKKQVPVLQEEQVSSWSGRGFEVDSRIEQELKDPSGGFRNVRRTKLVATIGPACCSYEQLETLAASGVNIARLNMCHGTHEWHRDVIRNVRKLQREKGYGIAVMIDTEGSEVHMGDLGGLSSAKAEDGEEWCFTVRKFSGPLPAFTLPVNYEGFAEDVKTGDELVVDGGMVRFEVLEKVGPDVKCKCSDPGMLLPCANLTVWRNGAMVRERNTTLPTISAKDWVDIDFGISEGVDFISISFVKTSEVIKHLRSYVAARSPERAIGIIAKIEDANSLSCLEDIIRVSDGVMVARGDLGAQLPLEDVPAVQEVIVDTCRRLNKPVIVASQLLESMIEFPTPTRAEVADVSNAVRQSADALMLSGESAMGLHPQKALEVLRTVSLRMEHWAREEGHSEPGALPEISTTETGRTSEQICNSAAQIANKLKADAIFVYTRRGYMASLLSRNRPDSPIFAFTESVDVMRRMELKWGVTPFQFPFRKDLESNLLQSMALLKAHGMVRPGNLVVAVSDVSSSSGQSGILQSVQVHIVS